ncbi:MAG: MFS transporter [Gemmatimonadaceae bacterium]|nr:MFS transporter [Gemmatimonadaceae bacterium]
MTLRDPAADPAARRRLMSVLFVAVFMSALDTAVVGPTLPALRDTFGVDHRAVALVTSVYVLCSLTATALLASLSDRRGRRPVFLASVAIFAVGSLLVAVSPGFWWLVAARAIQGVGAGGITPTASAIVGDVFPAAERGKALGLIGATFGMAFVFGPPLAAGVMTVATWPWIFLVTLPIAVFVMARAARAMPAHEVPHDARPLDLAGLGLTFATLVMLTLGITRLADDLAGRRLWPLALAAAAVSAVTLVRVETRAAAPLLPPALFANRQLAVTYAVTIGAGFGMGAVTFLASLAAMAYGMSPRAAGFMLLPLVVASMVGAAGGGRLMNAVGPRHLLLGGFALLGAGYAAMAASGLGRWVFLAASLPIGLGVGVVVGGSLRSIAIDEAPPAMRTVAQGVINIATAIGTLIAASVVSAVADFAGGGADGFATAYAAVAGLMMLAWVGTLALKPRVITAPPHEAPPETGPGFGSTGRYSRNHGP